MHHIFTMTILVTGANRGIGLEICRQLAHLKHHVILSARSAVRGENAVKDLAKEGLKADFLLLDTDDEQSILRAARELKQRIPALNVLINNAAILDTWEGTILDAKGADLRDTFTTNVIGPVLLTQALLALLEAGKPSRVINVSSQLGSVQNMTDGWPGYGISKAALNAATRKLAQALQSRGISVNAASPGWVRTEMGTDSAPLAVENGAKNIIRLITEMPHSLTNHFLSEHGEIPW
ncbi:MAG TPA: SDR family NAD(P)-dependent oxidoreductase [Candidatus Methylacidiphilales bacterium]|jgi:NAD(P)-dependent dehydrogenase (short-subunit alcohol dehydrogenase family)|nr:SDR family NAD(P)-dependent oxidoreductase [Candidatus Methylacidiphilales bacterium]